MKNLLQLIVLIFFAAMSGAMASAAAQSVPTISIQVAENPDLPDVMGTPCIFVGDEDHQALGITEIAFILRYDTLLDISDFEMYSSDWASFFNPDGNCEAWLSHDPVAKSVQIVMRRTDLVGQSGCGQVMRFGGVGIIDNIDLKRHPILVAGIAAPETKPIFGENTIRIQNAQVGWAEIRNLDGKVLLRQELVQGLTQIDVGHLQRGIYLLSLQQGLNHQTYKFQHLR